MLLLLAMAITLLLMPLFPQLFTKVFNVAGPLLIFSVFFLLVQWRGLGPISKSNLLHLPSYLQKLDEQVWDKIVVWSLCLCMLLAPLVRGLRVILHRFYSR